MGPGVREPDGEPAFQWGRECTSAVWPLTMHSPPRPDLPPKPSDMASNAQRLPQQPQAAAAGTVPATMPTPRMLGPAIVGPTMTMSQPVALPRQPSQVGLAYAPANWSSSGFQAVSSTPGRGGASSPMAPVAWPVGPPPSRPPQPEGPIFSHSPIQVFRMVQSQPGQQPVLQAMPGAAPVLQPVQLVQMFTPRHAPDPVRVAPAPAPAPSSPVHVHRTVMVSTPSSINSTPLMQHRSVAVSKTPQMPPLMPMAPEFSPVQPGSMKLVPPSGGATGEGPAQSPSAPSSPRAESKAVTAKEEPAGAGTTLEETPTPIQTQSEELKQPNEAVLERIKSDLLREMSRHHQEMLEALSKKSQAELPLSQPAPILEPITRSPTTSERYSPAAAWRAVEPERAASAASQHSAKFQEVTLQLGPEFVVEVDRSEDQELGVDAGSEDGTRLIVRGIRPGLVEEWNQREPSKQVRPGDILLEVNGIHGDAALLVAECSKAQVLKLRFAHAEEQPLRSSSTLGHSGSGTMDPANLQTELRWTRLELDESNRRNMSLQDKMQSLEETLNATLAKSAAMQRSMEAEKVDLRSQVRKLETDNSRLAGRLGDLMNHIQHLESRLNAAMAHVADVTRAHAAGQSSPGAPTPRSPLTGSPRAVAERPNPSLVAANRRGRGQPSRTGAAYERGPPHR